jgi:hypothetical protein
MRFLLNENIGQVVAEFLRNEGYDTKSAIEDFKGFSDENTPDSLPRRKNFSNLRPRFWKNDLPNSISSSRGYFIET